jgi:Pentapeptide repeats (9 copies)
MRIIFTICALIYIQATSDDFVKSFSFALSPLRQRTTQKSLTVKFNSCPRPSYDDSITSNHQILPVPFWDVIGKFAVTAALVTLTIGSPMAALAVSGDDSGASSAANAKLTTGGASTLQSGRTISITRGVNLDNSNFRGQNLKGVAFQQSVVRDTDFRDCNLVGASFFDATLDGSNFENADMSLANVEMAQFRRANLRNTILKEMYVSGSTLFEGVKDIENSDWSETFLRKDQQKYLCSLPSAKGTNPVTGVDTRESLACKD